jgi:hypothetical protein
MHVITCDRKADVLSSEDDAEAAEEKKALEAEEKPIPP